MHNGSIQGQQGILLHDSSTVSVFRGWIWGGATAISVNDQSEFQATSASIQSRRSPTIVIRDDGFADVRNSFTWGGEVRLEDRATMDVRGLTQSYTTLGLTTEEDSIATVYLGDLKGDEIVPCRYRKVGNFQEGYAGANG